MGFSRFFQSVSRRKQAKQFFLSNGALLLEKQITFGSVNNADPIKIFTAKEIQLAITNQILSEDFDAPLYKGFLDDQIVAIQQYSENQPRPRDEELIDEILNMVVIQSQISHRNIVKIIGCCLETRIPSVVYEFVPNGSLSSHIFGNQTAPLSWVQRLSVATQIAEALCYLHIAGSRCIIHRDLKPGIILLDEHFTPKIGNFSFSITTTDDERTVQEATIRGTIGYVAPEYYMTGNFTEMIDVYAFGVNLLQILSGENISRYDVVQSNWSHHSTFDETCMDQPSILESDESHRSTFDETCMDQPSILESDESHRSTFDETCMDQPSLLESDESHHSTFDETCVRAILEKAILDGMGMGQLKAAAELVVRCLRRMAVERPSMKEVVQEMHKIIKNGRMTVVDGQN